MKKQDLIDLGIAEDVAEKVIIAHGKDIEKFKTSVETAKAEIETVKSQLTEANTQIESFKGLDIEGVKKTADEYKAKFEQAQADATKQLAEVKFNHALEGALSGAKAKNTKAVQALLSKDALKYNEADNSIVGLNEQLEKIKSENGYLFEDGKEIKIVTGGNNQSVLGDPQLDAMRKGAGLAVPTK